MSERKVLNKYYPPDFDPTNIPRLKLPKTRQYTVRVMTPCNMKCNTCGDYIAKAKKFNARKETVEDETYLGLKIFRFYFKCPTCMAEITFKTDPKNCDYELEHGATRNFQAYRLAEMQAEKEAKDRKEEEELNPMVMLENRTKLSRKEMEELEALEELKEMSQRQITLDTDEFLKREKIRKQKFEEMMRKQAEDDDEVELQKMLDEQNSELFGTSSSASGSSKWVKVEESDEQIELEPEAIASESAASREDESEVADHSEPVAANSSDIPRGTTKFFDTTRKEPPAADFASKPESSKRKLAQLVKVVKKTKAVAVVTSAPSQPSKIASLCTYSDSDSN